MKAVPEISRKLESGQVNLSTMSKAQSIIKAQEKISGHKVSVSAKADVVRKIENKTTQQAEQILLTVFPEAASSIHQERKTVINENTTRLSTNISSGMEADLKRAKELLSHKFPSASDAEVLAHTLKFFLDSEDPLRRKPKPKLDKSMAKVATPTTRLAEITSASEAMCVKSPGEKILLPNKAAVRLAVIQQSNGACTFKDPLSGQVCGSRHQIQIDHIVPKAMGGTDEPSNLRSLCREHNMHEAEKKLGKHLMERYRRR